ncbi:conserved protein of unknown function [Georgfuchsia toluolica]|uniref:Uncharacterized protein n=1 Tax=Georgfuchsia toluolica TaxID=424218 RepID=A0A916N9N1_9PROT|nr:hypothetical protein [Georgfuchsia toluolica]CAG4884185.1 conserved protein of unknown function [Georgfuchsia toluolica]
MNKSKRLRRLQTLIGWLETGKDVARRDLQLVLTADEWDRYEAEVEQRRDLKAQLVEVPATLRPYIARLKRADFLYVRAESMVVDGDPRVRQGLYHQSESAYEAALVVLTEALGNQPDLVMWLDREFSLSPEKAPTPDPLAVPRLKMSKSGNRDPDGGVEWLTGVRRSLKLAALKSSFENVQVADGRVGGQIRSIAKNSPNKSAIQKKIDVTSWKV